MNHPTLYGPFSELISLSQLETHGAIADEHIHVKRNTGIVVEDGIIKEIDDYSLLLQKYRDIFTVSPDNNPWVALPSYVDCHTHICWAGTRVNDYAARVAGKSYLEIAAAGGGIMTTVNATREANQEQLIAGIVDRANKHLRRGISVIEVKSGYGLTVDDELKMLRAIKAANRDTAATLIPTFLGAHIKPKDFTGSNTQYLNMLLEQVIPIIQKEELAHRADIFVEEGAFTTDEARDYIIELQKLGFHVTMHVDQFHSEGGKVANELKCVSADHLEYTDEHGIAAFANSTTVAVALPGASLGLGMQYAPARALLDAGACLAIASDWNPGSAPMGDLVTQASLLGASEKLTIAETLVGITTRAAHALRIDSTSIEVGKRAQFNIYETNDFRTIFYQQGQLTPSYSAIGQAFIHHE